MGKRIYNEWGDFPSVLSYDAGKPCDGEGRITVEVEWVKVFGQMRFVLRLRAWNDVRMYQYDQAPDIQREDILPYAWGLSQAVRYAIGEFDDMKSKLSVSVAELI